MPKQKRIVRRQQRKTIKAKPHKVTQQQSPERLDENALKEIPPHLLDKIPSGAGLRPNAATLRMQMLNRFAPPYMTIPTGQTQQQQQVANMKNDNDIKEQIVNQVKQDMMVEHERKRKLQKEEASNKREMQTKEHNLALEQKQVDHELKQKDRAHALELKTKDLEYKKEELEQEGMVQELANQAAESEALVKQLEHEIQTLKNEHKYYDQKNRYDLAQSEVKRLRAERNAIVNTIRSMNSQFKVAEYQSLINEAARLKNEAVVLQHISDTKTKALITKLENQAMVNANSEEKLKTNEKQVKEAQVDLAKQLAEKEKHENILMKNDYLRNKRDEYWKRTQNTQLENKELERKIASNKVNSIDMSAVMAAQQDIINDQKRKELEATKDLNKKIAENHKLWAQGNYINSPAYHFGEQSRARLEAMANIEAKKGEQIKQSSEALADAKIKQFQKEIDKTVYGAIRNEEDPTEALIELGNQQAQPALQTAAYMAVNEQSAMISQANQRIAALREMFLALYNSPLPEGQQFQQYIDSHELNPDNMNLGELEQLESLVKNGYK